MNKQFFTYLLSFIAAAIGWWLSQPLLMSAGLFAFSGAVTNGLAIHMLFERVPFIYGSGVIPANFEKFKDSLRSVLMEEFFSQDNLLKWVDDNKDDEQLTLDLQPIIEDVDFAPAFDSLLSAVETSKFGSMLGMFGGTAALEPLREPFIDSLKIKLIDISQQDSFQSALQQQMASDDVAQQLREKISHVVEQKLEELSPQRVKQIVQNLVRQHLGWLVIWGGVFGAIFGAVTTFL